VRLRPESAARHAEAQQRLSALTGHDSAPSGDDNSIAADT
jgi:hypothetical protein